MKIKPPTPSTLLIVMTSSFVLILLILALTPAFRSEAIPFLILTILVLIVLRRDLSILFATSRPAPIVDPQQRAAIDQRIREKLRHPSNREQLHMTLPNSNHPDPRPFSN